MQEEGREMQCGTESPNVRKWRKEKERGTDHEVAEAFGHEDRAETMLISSDEDSDAARTTSVGSALAPIP